ncbi:MAG: hypothetical protein AAF840_01355 [Bacteroidota bacterium]
MNYHSFLAIFLAFVLFGCHSEASSGKYAPDMTLSAEGGMELLEDELNMEAPRTAEAPAPPAPSNAQSTPQKIIYTADVRARVEQLDTALAQVARQVQASGGFIAS